MKSDTIMRAYIYSEGKAYEANRATTTVLHAMNEHRRLTGETTKWDRQVKDAALKLIAPSRNRRSRQAQTFKREIMRRLALFDSTKEN